MGRRGLNCVLAAGALVAGCGPTPPQAPGPQAHQLNNALSAISVACGHATEIQTFANDARALATTEHYAQQQIPVLVRIYKRNPDWIYQGKTVAELVQMSGSYLDDCGLHAAARRLRVAAASG